MCLAAPLARVFIFDYFAISTRNIYYWYDCSTRNIYSSKYFELYLMTYFLTSILLLSHIFSGYGLEYRLPLSIFIQSCSSLTSLKWYTREGGRGHHWTGLYLHIIVSSLGAVNINCYKSSCIT